MNIDEFARQDTALRHAIQTGVLWTQKIEDRVFYEENPVLARILKHMRTGIDCAMCEHGAMMRLLTSKGIIKEEEFFEVSLQVLKEEVEKYEQELSAHFGRPISLR